VTIDLSDGTEKQLYDVAVSLRWEGWLFSIISDSCGVRARWFKPKEPEIKHEN